MWSHLIHTAGVWTEHIPFFSLFLIAFQVLFTYYDILYYFQFSLSSVYVCERVWLWCRHIVPQCEQGSQMTTSSVSLCLHFDWDTISCCEGLGGGAEFALVACLLLGFCCLLCLFVFCYFCKYQANWPPCTQASISLYLSSPHGNTGLTDVCPPMSGFTWVLGIRTLVLMLAW